MSLTIALLWNKICDLVVLEMNDTKASLDAVSRK